MSDLLAVLLLRFFRLILTFFHCAYSGVQYFNSAQNLIRNKMKKTFLKNQVPDAVTHVSNFVKELKKCPAHFVVILGNDEISFEDFTNLVVWCIAAKIRFISFYDHSGNLKSKQNTYYKHLINKGNINPCNLLFLTDKHSLSNGISQKVYVSFLSLEDGKPMLVQLAKDISKRIALNELNMEDIDEQFISNELFKVNGLPDPDLAVICGTICSSFGLLPWQIRVTEFLWLKSLKGIQVTDFTKILETYSSCEQRFGR